MVELGPVSANGRISLETQVKEFCQVQVKNVRLKVKFSEVFINTIQVIIKHQKKLETETELFVELQKLSVVSRSKASTSGVCGG